METILIDGKEYTIVMPVGKKTEIGFGSFKEVEGASLLYIPKGVRDICQTGYTIENVKEIIMADSVKGICYGTFSHGYKLENIRLSNKLIYIGDCAFANTNLKEITIPKSVKIVKYHAFINCKNLKCINIEDPNTKIISNSKAKGNPTIIHRSAFHECAPEIIMINGKPVGIDILRSLVAGGMSLKNYDTSTSNQAVKKLKLLYEVGELK